MNAGALANAVGRPEIFFGPVCGAESLAADRMIGQARLAHILGAIDIAKIDENIAAHGVKIMRRCQGPKLVPFGDDNRHIRAFEAGRGCLLYTSDAADEE